MNQSKSAIGALGEIALRVKDLDVMQSFYAEIVGLELMKRFESAAFFRIAEGFEGHTQVLALFDRSSTDPYSPPEKASSSVDHLAFTIAVADFDRQLQRLQSLGLLITTAEHSWVQWRSLYFDDPEGNVVELVCFDPSIESD